MVVDHPYLSITIEKVDKQWYPLVYYMGTAVSNKGDEYSVGLTSLEQLPSFVQGAETYFKGESNGN